MSNLLVIGGASRDLLHLRDGSVETVGGAGLYTALAAHRSGVDVALLAPRPEPWPAALEPVAERLTAWHGPAVAYADLPRFEISYRGAQTEYRQSTFGAVEQLGIEMLPAGLNNTPLIHVTPLGNPTRQLSFLRTCRAQGAQKLSAGTNFVFIEQQADIIRQVMDTVDYFFLNEREAVALFGDLQSASCAPGKVLYITLGAEGVRVIQGAHVTDLPTQMVAEVDPTGAGDSFCGGTLARLAQNHHPIMAARHALPLVTTVVEQVGPAALFADEPAPLASLAPAVRLNVAQLENVAEAIARHPGTQPHNFVTDALPPVDHPAAVDYFFAATLQQFSFWSVQDGMYGVPMWATIDGRRYKGSEYLWAAFWREQAADPHFCTPTLQAGLSHEALAKLMRADDGSDPLPAMALHVEQAQLYGHDMLALGLTPWKIIEEANAAERPLQTFLSRLDQIGGYKEDPLRKKSALLAKILHQRPEQFLSFGEAEDVPPVIDYHAMRACLRIGLIEIVDVPLRGKIMRRELISSDEEWIVRAACYQAYSQLVALSGKPYGAVGWFLFSSMRRYCLEVGEPLCVQCHLEPVCQQRRALFQPVIRTPFY